VTLATTQLAMLLALSTQVAAAPMTVAVLPLAGDADAKTKRALTERLVESLRGFEGLNVLALTDPAKLLGPQAAVQLRKCGDDRCRAAVLSALRTSRLVIGETAGDNVRVRLVDSSTTAAKTLVRVTQLLRREGSGALRSTAILIAQELFPDLGGEAAGTLMITADVDGATVFVDGTAMGTAPVGPVKLAPGPHQVQVTAPGHHPFDQTVTVELGRGSMLVASPSKNRSLTPLYLAGGAVVAAGVGVVLGVLAQGTVDDWGEACDGTTCAPGFTRRRFDGDQTAVQAQMIASNGLYAVSVGLAVGSLIALFTDEGQDVE